MKKASKDFTAKEVEQRMAAALKGARLVGHKPMKSASKKSAKPKKSTRGTHADS